MRQVFTSNPLARYARFLVCTNKHRFCAILCGADFRVATAAAAVGRLCGVGQGGSCEDEQKAGQRELMHGGARPHCVAAKMQQRRPFASCR